MEQYDYDLFVIGAGSGGVRACRIAASLGARVGVAEERYFGGTCVNVGCVPKKLFSYAAHYHDDLEDAQGFGWSSPGLEFSWETLIQNKDIEINRLNGIYRTILDNNEVTVYEARARIEGPHELCVDDRRITAKYILLAVGGWPWIPDYPGSEFAISSNEVFSLDSLPESITVVGGGYIALEFASIFTRLGSETSLVYRGDKLLRGFDEEIRDFISTEIGRHVDLKLEEDIVSIVNNNNKLHVLLKSGTTISCDTVLSATGRRPMTANLGLENVAVQLSEHGAIVVNDQFQTAESSIYAIGDAIDRLALTPVALAEGQIVARTLFGGEGATMDYNNIPTSVFCHPNLATVGLTEQQALDKGIELDVYLATVKQLKHSLSGRDELSMIKLIVEKSSDRVIGLHLICPDAGELVQGFAVAMNCGARKVDFDRTIGIHPTLAEEFVTMRTRRKSHAA